MTESNVQLVQRLFERSAEDGVEAVLPGLREDVVIEIPADMSAEPDTYRGHAGARRYFAGFDGMLDDVRFEPIDVTAVGELVLAHLRVTGRGASSGLDVELDAYVVTEFGDGKIVRMRPYRSRDAAQRAIAGAGD